MTILKRHLWDSPSVGTDFLYVCGQDLITINGLCGFLSQKIYTCFLCKIFAGYIFTYTYIYESMQQIFSFWNVTSLSNKQWTNSDFSFIVKPLTISPLSETLITLQKKSLLCNKIQKVKVFENTVCIMQLQSIFSHV